MKIAITGTTSGLGQELVRQISAAYPYEIIEISRSVLDLSNLESVKNYCLPTVDMLINCAGTGHGGKINYVDHETEWVTEIMTTNLLSPMLLSQKALRHNGNCKIVNVTSTNNKQYYANDLSYSLSKHALSLFGSMLQVDCPQIRYLEIRLGLTKTCFNQNRYSGQEYRFEDIYQQHRHLRPKLAVHQILKVLFDDSIKFIEIAP